MDVVYEAEDVKPGAMPPRSPYLKSLHGDSILECHQSFWNGTTERDTGVETDAPLPQGGLTATHRGRQPL
jgi:hypothetical protein